MEGPNNNPAPREKQSVSEEEIAKFKSATKEEINTAHDEANMLKAEAGHGVVEAYGGKGRNYAQSEQRFGWKENQGIRPITAEEYDKASQTIEELEATINDQVGIKKVLSKVGYGSMAILQIVLDNILDMPSPLIGGLKDPTPTFKEVMSRETLNKAKAKLDEMKKQGEEYGEENLRVNQYGIHSGKKPEQEEQPPIFPI